MQQKITLEELKRMLDDPEIEESALAPYVLDDPENSEAFRPAFRPNPDLVTGVTATEAAALLNVFNSRARRKRQRKYRKKLEEGWTGLKIVSEGDSWFQYPIRLDDVIDQLFDRYAIYSLGAAGDLLKEMVEDDEIPDALEEQQPDWLLLSGGGNDMVGKKRVATMLHSGNNQTAEDAPNANFNIFLDEIADLYRGMCKTVTRAFPGVRILIHGYDWAIPAEGKWLGRPMKSIGITDHALQTEITKRMIDLFNERLSVVAAEFPGRAFHVDCRGAVAGRWYDELHPTNPGYKDVADRFAEIIEQPVP